MSEDANPSTESTAGGGEHGHDGHHEHHKFQAHHWDTMQQQFEAGKLGMWLFLATEVLLFGGLFCAYFIYRSNRPELFEFGHHALNWKLGSINTVVLLASSLSMALGVRAAQTGELGKLKLMLAITFICGCGFMGIKYVEYAEKIEHGYLLGQAFDYEQVKDHEHHESEAHGTTHADEEPDPFAPANVVGFVPAEKSNFADASAPPSGIAPSADTIHSESHEEYPGADKGYMPPEGRPRDIHIFFSIYFMMTGLHGIHVLIGMAVIAWLFVICRDGRFGPNYFTPVEVGGLYWHLVDLIWIYLFPLLYLI